MVGVFKRSLSFPNKIPTRPPKPPLSHHIRSISLPCRSHPLISQLGDEINHIRTWSSDNNRTSSWLCDGLRRLKQAHDSLDDILQLPQSQESLRRHPKWVEKLLEDFLRFVDVYGIFQISVLSLKEEQLAAQVAVRKKDDSKIALYVKSRKKMAKEMSKLTSTIRDISQSSSFPGLGKLSITDIELVRVIGDVVELTVSVSVALFNGISLSFGSRKSSWMGLKLPKRAKKVKSEEGIKELQEVGVESLWGLRKKGEEEVRMVLKKMQDLEDCICGIESEGEKVFRSLINTKVSLLNCRTQ